MTYLSQDYQERGALDSAYLYRVDQVQQIQNDLYTLAISLGQTDAQAKAKIMDLFNTFPAEWSIYALAGADGIVTAIQNDGTLAWLDVEAPPASGVTIRQRLINRLS